MFWIGFGVYGVYGVYGVLWIVFLLYPSWVLDLIRKTAVCKRGDLGRRGDGRPGRKW